MRRDDQRLCDVIEAASDIARFISGFDSERAYQTVEVRNATLYSFCVIGEAIAHVSDELKARHPEVSWRNIKDFRNIIAHGYFKLDWPLIWEAATERLPKLEKQIKAILTSEFPGVEPNNNV